MKNMTERPAINDVKVLFEIQQGDKFLVGKVIEIKGKKFLDVRSHYVDDKRNKVPTSRGIRLSYGDTNELYCEGVLDPDYFNYVSKVMLEGGDATQRTQ